MKVALDLSGFSGSGKSDQPLLSSEYYVESEYLLFAQWTKFSINKAAFLVWLLSREYRMRSQINSVVGKLQK